MSERGRSRWTSGAVQLLLAACLAGSLACAPVVRPLGPTLPPALAADEGILILHVDSDVPLHSVLLEQGVVAERIDAGRHVWMMRVAAGRYCWQGVRAAERGDLQRIDPEECGFEIEPGVINYPGTLIVRDPDPMLPVAWALWVRVGNRGATAVRRLRERQSAVLDAFPIRYAGSGEDTFLEYYDGVRRDPARARAGQAAAGPRP